MQLENLDIQILLDFKNDHVLNLRMLSSLGLQSCCLVIGDGLKTFGIATSNWLQELALINCDVVERELAGASRNVGVAPEAAEETGPLLRRDAA